MPVCKFYLKGNCKYGDRCFNDHPRHLGAKNERRDQYDDGWRDNSWGGNKHQQNHEQRYQSPMTQRTDQWHGNYSTGGSRTNSRNHGEGYNYHHTHHDSNTSDRQHGYRTSHDDKYHWSKNQQQQQIVSGNRFDKLRDESGPGAQIDAVMETIKSDIKTWASSSMWPFSCYSHTKGNACIDGLPDVSPEEMRVVFLLHQQQYQSVWNELEANYCKRKDELFEMSDSEKQNLIAQIQNTDSNPSEHLKVSLLYGTGNDFKKQPDSSSTSSFNSPATKLPSPNSLPNPTTTVFNSNTSKPIADNSNVNVKKPAFSVFGSPSAQANSNYLVESDICTPFDDLSAHEKASFEAAKFVLGRIPNRPPPTQYCS